jgi:OmpA-OmpF porin, OOP family
MTLIYKPAATIFTIAAVICTLVSAAQQVYDYKRSADRFYVDGDYFSAAEYYEKALDQKSNSVTTEPYTVQKKGAKSRASNSRQEIVFRIAESYRLINNYTKAEKWYAEAATFNKAEYPLTQYWYGVSLRANGKFNEAEKNLQEFINTHKTNDEHKKQAQLELADVKFIQQQLSAKEAGLYEVKGVNVNSIGADYAASWNNGGLIFTSTRADSSIVKNKKKNPHVNNLYWAQNTDGVFSAAQKISIPAATDSEQGIAAFTRDGNRMYFTRWTKKAGKNLASIYVSENTNGTWSEPVLAGGKINAEGYSSQQPHITADGQYLLFASDRPGGSGKFDLYYASLRSNGEAGAVNNLGSMINTAEDDQSPFYHQATQTLVFATKGRVGMGGFDLFETKGVIGNTFGTPTNLGYPVNSIKDDLYFFSNGSDKLLRDAFISSDRSSECCLQLFTVNKTYKKYISGTVTDCNTTQPIAAAKVRVTDDNGKSLFTLTTNNAGTYSIELNSFQAMQLTASKESYNDKSLGVSQPSGSTDTLMNPAICLSPVPVEQEAEPQPEEKKDLKVYFDFAQYDLRPETGVLLDTLIALMKREPKLGMEIYGFTDKKGSENYNEQLSKLRAEACKAYLVKNGIAATRLKVFAKGECCEEAPETTPDGKDDVDARQLNRRVEFKIVLLYL